MPASKVISADQAAANALAVLAAAEEGSEPYRAIREPGRGLVERTANRADGLGQKMQGVGQNQQGQSLVEKG